MNFWILFPFFVYSACIDIVYRKEVRDMTPTEWKNFVDAFITLRNNGRLSVYVNWHINAMQTFHWNAKFLPFHRAYLLEFENELIKAGAPFLPFWDWTFESQDVLKSPILTEKYLGQSNGTFVIDSPFKRDLYKTTTGGGLVREYTVNSTIVFYAQRILKQTIMVPEFSDFSRRCEVGPHASVHILIGGNTGHLARATSPEDPLFWCHHAFIDKLWVKHQTTFGYQYSGKAFNSVNTLNDTVGYPPWTKKVSDVLHSSDLCVEYIQPNPENMGIGIGSGVVSIPDSNKDWLADNGANITFIDTLDNKTKSDVDKINNSGSGVGVNCMNNLILLFIVTFIQ